MTQHVESECECPLCRARRHLDKSEAVEHFRAARREMLLGVKAIIEGGLERLEPKQESHGPARRVEVETE